LCITSTALPAALLRCYLCPPSSAPLAANLQPPYRGPAARACTARPACSAGAGLHAVPGDGHRRSTDWANGRAAAVSTVHGLAPDWTENNFDVDPALGLV